MANGFSLNNNNNNKTRAAVKNTVDKALHFETKIINGQIDIKFDTLPQNRTS